MNSKYFGPLWVVAVALCLSVLYVARPAFMSRPLTHALSQSPLVSRMQQAQIERYVLFCSWGSQTVGAELEFDPKTGRDSVTIHGSTPCSRSAHFNQLGTLVQVGRSNSISLDYKAFSHEDYEPTFVLEELTSLFDMVKVVAPPPQPSPTVPSPKTSF